MKMRFIAILFVFLFTSFQVFPQSISQKQGVYLTAHDDMLNSQLILSWPASTDGTNYYIYKRPLGSHSWKQIATLGISDTQYVDKDLKPGEAMEYTIYRTSGNSIKAFGYVYGGMYFDYNPYYGGIILLIDSNYIQPLNSEIDRLVKDLFNDGWKVYKLYAGRSEKPDSVKARIQSLYAKNKGLTTLFILGNIPIPYSGDFAIPPDGHVVGSGNHTDAWPADVYYGDLDGEWTDKVVNIQTSKKQKAWNIPFDGKFDQTYIPSEVELEVGRVDLTNLSDFSDSDTALTRYYLDKNHAFRTGGVQFARRGLVDDNFKSLNLASTGWDNQSAFFGLDKVNELDYFNTLNTEDYLWSYGCGAGSPTSCAGLKNNGRAYAKDFATDSVRTVFTMLAGSFFGDWDYDNSFLRAPLASKPSILACFWGGIPKWHVFHMAMGTHLGLALRITQENTNYITDYFHGAFNYSEGKVHIALMGDPSLRMYPFSAPSSLKIDSINASQADLSWVASNDPEVIGYNIYRAGAINDSFIKLNSVPVTELNFSDNATRNGMNVYQVRAVKLEKNSSGSFLNQSPAVTDSISITWPAGVSYPRQPLYVNAYPNPSNGNVFIDAEFGTGQKIQIEVFDLLGNTILVRNYSATMLHTSLDLSAFKNQLLLIQVQCGNDSKTFKISIE